MFAALRAVYARKRIVRSSGVDRAAETAHTRAVRFRRPLLPAFMPALGRILNTAPSLISFPLFDAFAPARPGQNAAFKFAIAEILRQKLPARKPRTIGLLKRAIHAACR